MRPQAPYTGLGAIFLLALFTLTGGCIQERDREAEMRALVEQTVRDRIENYKQVRMERCREDMLVEASRRVDSIMILEATLNSGSGAKPPRPNRPSRPDMRRLDDTLPVRPLLPTDSLEMDSVKQDTIQVDTISGEG